MEELKKLLHKLQFDYYEHGSRMDTIIPDSDIKSIIDLVESKIKKAKISESEYWRDQIFSPEFSSKPTISLTDFINRILELHEGTK